MQKTAASNKRALSFFLGSFTALSAYGCAYQYKEYLESKARWDKIHDKLKEFTPTELKKNDAKNYPWYRNSNVDDWEFQLVKLIGYFKEERFFVRKQREGRAGYSVLAPFITAIEDNDPFRTTQANPPVEYGLMVNLGWVPLENKQDIEKSSEPLPLLVINRFIFEFTSSNIFYRNQKKMKISQKLIIIQVFLKLI